MSDLQPNSPTGAHAPVELEAGRFPAVPDGVTALTSAVHDSAVRAAVALGRVHAVARIPALLDVRDPLTLELTVARDALCDAVGALAACLRRDGLPPQRMLVLVKDAVRTVSPLPAEALAAREIMSDAVRCGIAAYYAVA